MEKKKKIIIFVTLFVMVFIFFILLNKENVVDFNSYKLGKQDILEYKTESVDIEYEVVTKDNVKESSDEFLVVTLAKNFVERFGSWSIDNRDANLKELESLSSAKMQKYLENNLNFSVDDSIGITTKSLSTDIISFDEENKDVNVTVKTQRIKTFNDLTKEVYYQDIDLFIILSGNKWLVEEVNWK